MLTPFNRRELLTTTSAEEQTKVRELLRANQVPFYEKTVDVLGAMARKYGTSDQDLKCDRQYVFYVRKSDFEKAKELTGEFRRDRF